MQTVVQYMQAQATPHALVSWKTIQVDYTSYITRRLKPQYMQAQATPHALVSWKTIQVDYTSYITRRLKPQYML